MLKLPTHERGKPWTLRVVKNPPVLGGRKCWGMCRWNKREIVIWKGAQNHGVARDTLIHELLHRYMPWLYEDVVNHMATEIDDVLDMAESEGILEL